MLDLKKKKLWNAQWIIIKHQSIGYSFMDEAINICAITMQCNAMQYNTMQCNTMHSIQQYDRFHIIM